LIQSPHFQGNPKATLAITLALAAALTSSIAMLGLHRLKEVHPWAVVVHYSGVATVFVLASFFVGDLPDIAGLQDSRTLALLGGVGITATLGQFCITQAFARGEPARVSVVGLAQIVFALGLDLAFTGQLPQAITLAGITLVLAPTAWMMAERAVQHAPRTVAVTAGEGADRKQLSTKTL
jgi:drug/metabolite transporter (DMT)-like permease